MPLAGVLRCAPRGHNPQRISLHRPTVHTLRVQAGQISESQLGIYFYNARYYDPYLARFIQADTIIPSGDNTQYLALIISYNEYPFLLEANHANQRHLNRPITNVPDNPVAYDRYAYANNNAQLYTDPSGHDSYGNFTITTEEWVDYLRDANYVLILMERNVKTWETVGEILGGGIGAIGGAIIGAPTGPGMVLSAFAFGVGGTALGLIFGNWVGGGQSLEEMEDVIYWMDNIFGDQEPDAQNKVTIHRNWGPPEGNPNSNGFELCINGQCKTVNDKVGRSILDSFNNTEEDNKKKHQTVN